MCWFLLGTLLRTVESHVLFTYRGLSSVIRSANEPVSDINHWLGHTDRLVLQRMAAQPGQRVSAPYLEVLDHVRDTSVPGSGHVIQRSWAALYQ